MASIGTYPTLSFCNLKAIKGCFLFKYLCMALSCSNWLLLLQLLVCKHAQAREYELGRVAMAVAS